ncbi:unnamed protein product [Blepharisma stoltei]|uniref:Uncharacterized protein n=1 Tax=Blepharisma stoltei TaxID=1481888 RepID=A0AAU9IB52_9CILI|nr:unnamed protein product [Blepharisma stoltei]
MNLENAKSLKLPKGDEIIKKLSQDRTERIKSRKNSMNKSMDQDSTNFPSVSNGGDISGVRNEEPPKNPKKDKTRSYGKWFLFSLCKWSCIDGIGS